MLRITAATVCLLTAALAQPREDEPLCSVANDSDIVFRGRFLGAERKSQSMGGEVVYEVLEVLSGEIPVEHRTRLRVSSYAWPENAAIHLVAAHEKPRPAGHARWTMDDEDVSAVRIIRYLRDARGANRAVSLAVRAIDGANDVAGATVTVTAKDGKKHSSTTDSEGKAEFTALSPGSYTMEVAKEGHRASDPSRLSLREGSCRSESAFIWPESSISGVLTADGVPVSNVEMHLFSADEIEPPVHVPVAVASTAADGAFSFRSVPTGRYRVAANARPPESSTIVIPRFFPAADREQDGLAFEIGPGKHHSVGFEIAGMGRLTDIKIRGRTADGAELYFDFLPITVSDSSGRSISNCCSATPRLRSSTSQVLRVFENLIYRFEPARTSKGGLDSLQCLQSLPTVLPKGPKPNLLTLTFQPVPCPQ